MNNKTIIIGIILLVVLSGAIYYFTKSEDSNQKTAQIDSNIENAQKSDKVNSSNTNIRVGNTITNQNWYKEYTLAEVSEHDTQADCWMAINGEVFDVTEYIDSHPGGEIIISGCGTDATDLFENRPNGTGAHSQNAVAISQNYFIGQLK